MTRPLWRDCGNGVWRADWHGLALFATDQDWELREHGQRVTGANYWQPHGQRPASAAVRLDANQAAAFNAAWRRVGGGDDE